MKIGTYKLTFVLLSLCVCRLSLAEESQKLTITGQVVNCAAKPVEGAEVAVYEVEYRNGEFFAKVIAPIIKTNQNGRFEFQEDVSSQYNTFIVARKEGLTLAWDGLNYSSNTKGRGHFLLVLEKPCTLTGMIVDHNGNPVNGAKVQAIPKTSYMSRLSQRPIYAPEHWFTTQTNSKGVFRFDSFAADVNSDFWVKAPNLNCTYTFTTHYQNCCGFEVGRSDIRLVLPQEGTIKGQVVEAKSGRPVGGVELTVRADRDREDVLNRYRACTVMAKVDGTFICKGLPEGKNKIEIASLESQTSQWIAKSLEVNVVPGQSMDDIRLPVEKGGIIECTVREYSTEQSLSHIRVSAYNETSRTRSVTDETGTAKLRVLPGDYQVNASGQGYNSWRVNEPVVVKEGQNTCVDVQLAKSPNIRGLVTNSNGQPAEKILVTIHPFGDHIYTDGEGRFVAGYEEQRVEQGLYIIARDLEHSLTALVRTKKLGESIQLSLDPALTVKGKVADPNGTGIPAARVSLCIRFANCLSKIGAEVLADSQGRFEFKAIPPKQNDFDYRISIHAAGFAPKTYDRISIEAEPGTTADVGVVQLLPANLSISGIVVDANGIPAPGVILFLRGADGVEQPDKSTATDEKGRFAFKRICKGPVRVQVNFRSSPGGSGSLRAGAGDQDLRAILGQDVVHSKYQSLVGNSFPGFTDLGIEPDQIRLENKAILFCFFDMNQRPSRHCVMQLVGQAQQFGQNGVTVVAIQTSKVDRETLNEWVKKNNIPYAVGMIEGDSEKISFAWGVQSLPWLILSDDQHVVMAEGFNIDELWQKVKESMP